MPFPLSLPNLKLIYFYICIYKHSTWPFELLSIFHWQHNQQKPQKKKEFGSDPIKIPEKTWDLGLLFQNKRKSWHKPREAVCSDDWVGGLWSQSSLVESLFLPCISCMISENLFKLSVSQFSQPKSGDHKSINVKLSVSVNYAS